MLQDTDAQPSPAVSNNTKAPEPPRDAPPLTARTLRYHRRIAARATMESANPHDYQADFPPAKIPVGDRSPVVPIAYPSPTTITHTPLTTPSGPFPTVDYHHIRRVLPSSPSRASPSMASSINNKTPATPSSGTAFATAETDTDSRVPPSSSVPFSFLAPIWSTLIIARPTRPPCAA